MGSELVRVECHSTADKSLGVPRSARLLADDLAVALAREVATREPVPLQLEGAGSAFDHPAIHGMEERFVTVALTRRSYLITQAEAVAMDRAFARGGHAFIRPLALDDRPFPTPIEIANEDVVRIVRHRPHIAAIIPPDRKAEPPTIGYGGL
jgi:hypothetical protein